VWGAPSCPLTTPLCLYKASGRKTLGESTKFPEEFRISAIASMNFGGQKSLFRHSARTGKCPRSHLH
jgi:hypothetical protein